VHYQACDIDDALVQFLREALRELGVHAELCAADLCAPLSLGPADLALLLKTLPCLEAQLGAAALDVIEALPAPRVAVSFALRALGDRRRRLRSPAERFERAIAERGWRAESFEAAGELVFVVQTRAAAAGSRPPA
jgi:16S rRNA (guanine(1405)-N(7))-methyltransferase